MKRLRSVNDHLNNPSNATTFDYDAIGNRKKITDPGGDTQFTYDALDRSRTSCKKEG